MKKIVGIIAALALAGSVFARPDITPVITSFTGNAKLEWIANLDDDTYGFANDTWTQWKIQTKSGDWGGESNQSADGMWGELVLRTCGDITTEFGKDEVTKNPYDWKTKLEVSTAKIHFIDGDTYFHMDILKPDFAVGEIGYVRATKIKDDGTLNYNNWEDLKFGKVGGFAAYQGFTLNFGIPIVDLVFAFGDDGAKSFSDGHYAFKFAATLKPIDGLSIYAGVAKNTEDNSDLAFAATVGYNYKLNDQFYIKPAIQFDMYGDAKNFSAGLLFGWGSEGQTGNHNFLTFAETLNISVANNDTRTADGISVVFTKALNKDVVAATDPDTVLLIEAYDSKLLTDLGFGNFTWGAAYRAFEKEYAGVKMAELGKGCLAFGFIYNNTFDIVYVTARASFGMDLDVEGDNNAFKYGLRVGTTELIANTDVYADYVAGFSKYSPADDKNKGTLVIGTQINF